MIQCIICVRNGSTIHNLLMETLMFLQFSHTFHIQFVPGVDESMIIQIEPNLQGSRYEIVAMSVYLGLLQRLEDF